MTRDGWWLAVVLAVLLTVLAGLVVLLFTNR